MFDAVGHAIRAVGRPLLLVADDLHWFDPESLRLIHYLVRTGSDLPLLVTATARPEVAAEDHPVRTVLTGLRALGQVLERELTPLSADEVAALASRLGGDVPDAAALHADSEGNPLFLVEALRAGWPARRQVTPRVRAVIESRLAQLSPPTRDLLGMAATVGREFTADVLAAASGSSADDVLAALDELWLRRIIRDQGGDAYDFAHDKIREVTYAAAPPARRRHHHRAVADAMSRAGADTPDELSGRIADHYLRAGAPEHAAGWTLRAADAAARLHATGAAIAIVTRNVLALRALPSTSERERHELVLLTAVVGLIGTDEGFTAERVLRVQTRALALAERLGEPPEPTLIRSLALTSLSRADFPHAREYGEQLRARGERTDDDVLLVEGTYVLGIVAFWEGRLSAAREHFEHAVLRFRPEHRTTHILRYGLDTRVVCQSRLANTLWLLGEQDAAVAARDRALVMAEEGGHPFSLATALTFAAFLAVDMAATDELRHFTRRLRSLRLDATAHMLAVEALHGLVTAVDGQAAEGLRVIDDALERARSRPPTPGTPATFLRLRLAAALATGNRVEAVASARALLGCGYGTWRSLAQSVLANPTSEERSRNASSATLG